VRRPAAIFGSVVFLLIAPGSLTVLLPWWLTGLHWHSASAAWLPVRLAGGLLVVAGASFVVSAFARFVREGLGTPAPVAPPTELVVGGVYRYVRNPMYVAVTAILIGEALLLFQPVLLIVAAITLACMVSFVRLYEEPNLAQRFGASYEQYRRNVPGWWPRRRPWTPSRTNAP
jgi:protein-S-isoprenylcysteine O-methyltransferase Ste14